MFVTRFINVPESKKHIVWCANDSYVILKLDEVFYICDYVKIEKAKIKIKHIMDDILIYNNVQEITSYNIRSGEIITRNINILTGIYSVYMNSYTSNGSLYLGYPRVIIEINKKLEVVNKYDIQIPIRELSFGGSNKKYIYFYGGGHVVIIDKNTKLFTQIIIPISDMLCNSKYGYAWNEDSLYIFNKLGDIECYKFPRIGTSQNYVHILNKFVIQYNEYIMRIYNLKLQSLYELKTFVIHTYNQYGFSFDYDNYRSIKIYKYNSNSKIHLLKNITNNNYKHISRLLL